MSCGEAGRNHSVYSGNQVGWLNFVGDYNFVAGGPAGSGLSEGTTVTVFIPNINNRAVWLRKDAQFNDKLLDAAYPTIDLQWFADIQFDATTVFRVSDRAFYVQDVNGLDSFYDARVDKAPFVTVTAGEWLAQNFEIGDVTLSLNNRDGFYNDYLPNGSKFKQWTGVKVSIKIGFGSKYENYMSIFEGVVTEKAGLTTTRDAVEVKAYDKFDADEVSIPARSFNADIFPFIESTFAGKSVPLVYGDWSTEVPTWGGITAICTNALEEAPDSYVFKISDTELAGIDSMWLHRGNRTSDSPQGPIRIADNRALIDLAGGEITIPASGVVLDEPYNIGSKQKAGVGSTALHITSDDGFNFLQQGVKVGDKVVSGSATQASVTIGGLEFRPVTSGAGGNGLTIQYIILAPDNTIDQDKAYATYIGSSLTVYIPSRTEGASVIVGQHTAGGIKKAIYDVPAAQAALKINLLDADEAAQPVPYGPVATAGGQNEGAVSVITSVSNFALEVSGSFTFAPAVEYTIQTVQYTYMKSDKVSVVCRGKSLNLVSVNSLGNYAAITQPSAIAIAYDGSTWIADDGTQKFYNLSFRTGILQTIDYATVSASITSVGGIDIAADGKLWLTDRIQSKIYQYDIANASLGMQIATAGVTGIGAPLGDLSGVSVKPDTTIWIVDKTSHVMYLIQPNNGVLPYVVRSLNTSLSAVDATEPLDVSYDTQTLQLTYVDRATNRFYRVDETTGGLISSVLLTTVSSDLSFVSGARVAQDGTLVFLDQGTLGVYNYNDMADAYTNPAVIARDLLSRFGGHSYEEFDLSWMQTARQMAVYRARTVIDSKTDVVKAASTLLNQFNTVLHLRFQKYALFYITFSNMVTSGKKMLEKDLAIDTFKPGKEINQYFNSANANINVMPFAGTTSTSDTYISPAAVSFAGREIPKTLDLPSVYRRQDLDRLMPLYVRLAAPEPEFIEVTCGFRLIRLQIQDFISLTFDEAGVTEYGVVPKASGRRFTNVPGMIRKIGYDLDAMTVSLKIWSLGNTAFPGYTPPGVVIGGAGDVILLSTLGRPGHVSPVGTITASSTNSVTLTAVLGQNAESRLANGYKAWVAGYTVDVLDAATKAVVQTLTIAGVSGSVVTFVEDLAVSLTPTVKNTSGFAVAGHLLQYSTYSTSTLAQQGIFASFGKPGATYPTSRSQEIAEQRSGAHNFDDSSLPYLLYPLSYSSDL